MSRRWVVNASPLILLGKVGRVELLWQLCDELIVPQAVLREVGGRPEGQGVAQELAKRSTVTISGECAVPTSIRAWDLGPGESQVLAIAASKPVSRGVLDDREARRCAAACGIPVIGTLGVVLRAQNKGILRNAQDVINDLRTVGLYVTDDLITAAMARWRD